MDFAPDRNEHHVARTFGVIAGLALAVLLAKLSLVAVYQSAGTNGWIFLMFVAIQFGVPLFLVTLGITIYLASKRAIGLHLAMVMWLPILASLAIIPVTDFFMKR